MYGYLEDGKMVSYVHELLTKRKRNRLDEGDKKMSNLSRLFLNL